MLIQVIINRYNLLIIKCLARLPIKLIPVFLLVLQMIRYKITTDIMKQILITSLTVLLLSSLALHSQEPQSTFQQAREEFNEGIRKGLDKQYQQALEHFEEALELNPLYAEAHLYCGISLIELEDYPQAIKKISIAMEIDPSLSDQAYYFRGMAKSAARDYPGAIHDYSQAIMISPDHISFFQRGKAHFAQESFGKALQDFEVTMRMKPDFAEGILLRGKALYHVGLLSEALDDLNRAAGSFPDAAEVYYYRSLVYRDLNNQLAARENLQMAEQLGTSASLHNNDMTYDASPLPTRNNKEEELPASTMPSDPEPENKRSPEGQHEGAAYEIKPGFYDHNLAHAQPGKGLGIQVASYSASHKLVGLATAYRERYQQPVFIHVSELNERKLFKIILGDFDQRSLAESMRNTLRAAEFADCFIVTYEQLK